MSERVEYTKLCPQRYAYEDDELGLDIRLLPGYSLIYQRVGDLLLVLATGGDGLCIEVRYRYKDPGTGFDTELILYSSRYPCLCVPSSNLCSCINYGMCCDYTGSSGGEAIDDGPRLSG